MNRNMVLAILLSSAIYIVWFGFVSPPQKTEVKNQAESKETAAHKPAETSNSARLDINSVSKNQKKGSAITIKSEKAAFLIEPFSAEINDIIYSGPVSEINLSLSQNSAFLRTLENLDWKKETNDSLSAVFSASLSKEIKVKKIFSFSKEQGINKLVLEFKNNSSKKFSIPSFPIELGPGLGTAKSEMKENPDNCKADYTYMEEGKKHPSVSHIKESYEKGDWIWAGLNNRYFLFAIFNEGDLKEIKTEKKEIDGKKYPLMSIYSKSFDIAPGETKNIIIPFYAGAKDYKLLKSLGKGLDRAVDFGFFSPISKLADSALHFFHSKTGNYGIAIILLSITIQIIIFPLSMKSYKAMAVMKKLQPEMQALQVKYKDDPKRMNTELMELYKKYGANPLSGCWPMLLQIPVFFALYTALRNSWNLHGASFAFWIKDLSAKDPYYALPILMGALMFLQQHISPQTGGDPAQAKIMKWMPLLFTFMFLSLPSGLVIYWIINSFFSLGQTLYLKNSEENGKN
ncbi:MAG: membrane protein insertase YidC [Elusimicrobia bacterium]|nr:membrane protein insertase YidC [Elusimicrobiota bacterium]